MKSIILILQVLFAVALCSDSGSKRPIEGGPDQNMEKAIKVEGIKREINIKEEMQMPSSAKRIKLEGIKTEMKNEVKEERSTTMGDGRVGLQQQSPIITSENTIPQQTSPTNVFPLARLLVATTPNPNIPIVAATASHTHHVVQDIGSPQPAPSTSTVSTGSTIVQENIQVPVGQAVTFTRTSQENIQFPVGQAVTFVGIPKQLASKLVPAVVPGRSRVMAILSIGWSVDKLQLGYQTAQFEELNYCQLYPNEIMILQGKIQFDSDSNFRIIDFGPHYVQTCCHIDQLHAFSTAAAENALRRKHANRPIL